MRRLRILLADDHTLVRAGIRSLLNHVEGIEIVAEAEDGHHALELITRHRPDVALVDVTMPGLNGLEVASRVATACPEVRVLILSMHANEEYVGQALRAGASGYLLKDASSAELELALRAVARGDTYLSPQVSKAVIAEYLEHAAPVITPLERLTARQREILQLIAEGSSTKAIAKMLDLSVKTVETHRGQLMERLDIHDVAGLVRFAVRAGIVSPER